MKKRKQNRRCASRTRLEPRKRGLMWVYESERYRVQVKYKDVVGEVDGKEDKIKRAEVNCLKSSGCQTPAVDFLLDC